MRRDERTSPEDLNRPDGNSLVENYRGHDILEEHFYEHVEDAGLGVEAWGIDMREDDGEGIIYSDLMDFKLWDGEQLAAIVDVKSKSSDYWMLKCNERHWHNYREIAEDFDVPTYICFGLVSDDNSVEYTTFVPVHKDVDVVTGWKFPDYNDGAEFDDRDTETWDEFWSEVL